LQLFYWVEKLVEPSRIEPLTSTLTVWMQDKPPWTATNKNLQLWIESATPFRGALVNFGRFWPFYSNAESLRFM